MEELAERFQEEDVEELEFMIESPDIKSHLISHIREQMIKDLSRAPANKPENAFDVIFSSVPNPSDVDTRLLSSVNLRQDYRTLLEELESTRSEVWEKINFDSDAIISRKRIESLVFYLGLLETQEIWERYWESPKHKVPQARLSDVRRAKPLNMSDTIIAICGSSGVLFQQLNAKTGQKQAVSRKDVALFFPEFFNARVAMCRKQASESKVSAKTKAQWKGIDAAFWEQLSPVIYTRVILDIMDNDIVRKGLYKLWHESATQSKMDKFLYSHFMRMLKTNYCNVEDCAAIAQANVAKKSSSKQDLQKKAEQKREDNKMLLQDRKKNAEQQREDKKMLNKLDKEIDAFARNEVATQKKKETHKEKSLCATTCEKTYEAEKAKVASQKKKKTQRKKSCDTKCDKKYEAEKKKEISSRTKKSGKK